VTNIGLPASDHPSVTLEGGEDRHDAAPAQIVRADVTCCFAPHPFSTAAVIAPHNCPAADGRGQGAGRTIQRAEPADAEPGTWITREMLGPGCVGVKRELKPSLPNREHLWNLQSRAHNGLSDEENLGHRGNFHAGMWVRNRSNPGQTQLRGLGEPEFVEARAGYNLDEPIERLQSGDLPPCAPGEVWHFWEPTDPNEGDWDAQVMMCWASDGNVEYTRKELSLATKEGGRPFIAQAVWNAAAYADGAFETDPKWARNPSNMAPRFREGVVCTTAILKAKQASGIRRMEAAQLEKYGAAACRPVNALRLTGLAAWNAACMSARTLEHMLWTAERPDGKRQYRYLGQIVVTGRCISEAPFPGPAKQLPPLSSDDPRTVEYEARENARLNAKASKL
jgi:hypothetical protein